MPKSSLLNPLLALLLAYAVCGSQALAQDEIDNENIHLRSIRLIHPSNFGIDRAELDTIKASMQQAVDEGFIPGALLLVGNGRGVGVLETVGMQGPDSDTPVNADTLFRIYSMTKPIISVATLSLAEDGLLALDDAVSDYIPEFGDLQVIDRDSGEIGAARVPITIEHLLTHQSGIVQEPFAMNTPLGPRYRDSFVDILTGPDPADKSAEYLAEFNSITARELAGRIGRQPVLFEPGSAWHYGHSTDVLGAVLEVAAGKPLDEVLREHIFAPIGMSDTSFYVDPSQAFRIAEPYYGPMTDNTIPRAMFSGGGGLNSSAEDYLRFAAMLLNGGSYRGNRIIERATLDRMREKTFDESVSREFFFYGDVSDWGLGFHLQPTSDDPNGPHNFGWRGIGGTIFIVDEENDFFLVYMEQRWGGPQGAPFDNNAAVRMVYEAMRN